MRRNRWIAAGMFAVFSLGVGVGMWFAVYLERH